MIHARQHSPAASRNRGPILEQLRRVLPARGDALEIASGSGEHAAHFAAALPGWTWHPSDPDPGALNSIRAWCASLPNVAAPLQLNVLSPSWEGVPAKVDAIFCANMLHIAPWATCPALMRGAARLLSSEGLLILYGPYIVDGEPTAASNLAFDADLRSREPAWGLRRLGDVVEEADRVGLGLQERIQLPANNLLLVLSRTRVASEPAGD